MASRRDKISLSLKRFKDFLSVFKRSRRGMIGAAILVLFTIMALAAPLLAPNDPVWGYHIAGPYAVPSLFRILPGGEYLTFNMKVGSSFTTPSTLQEWNFTSNPSGYDVSANYDSKLGSSQIGCIAISFKRQAGETLGTVEAVLSKEFNFPYRAPPPRFKGTVAFLVDGVELVPTQISTFIRVGDKEYELWNSVRAISETTGEWLNKTFDSFDARLVQKLKLSNPAKEILTNAITNTAGDFTYGIKTSFIDTYTPDRNVEVTVYVDDFTMRFYGDTYGALGTDFYGRDIYAQLLIGARLSLFVGLLSAGLSVAIGLIVGLIAGYLGRIVDEIMMRFTDMMLVLPGLPLLLVLIAVLGPSLWNLIFLIGVLGWMGFARVVRSQVLSLKERPYIEAAKAVGAGNFHIIMKHLMPNVVSLVYVTLALSVPSAILSEAALSWLGLFDPTVMSWGRMLHDAHFYQGADKWWWVVPPGLCIAAVSLSFVLLGYALDEILNPKLRQRR